MPHNRLPIGAALRFEELPDFADWLIEGERDLELQNPVTPAFLDSDWTAAVAEVRRVLDGYTGRMGIHGPFLGLTLVAEDPKIRQICLDRFKQGIEVAAELGATHMVMHSPFNYFGDPFIPFRGRLHFFINMAMEMLNELIPLAEAADLTLVLENIMDKNPHAIKSVVDACDSPHVQHSIDVGHAFLKHAEGGVSPDGWVQMTGEKLAHLHLQDTDGLGDRHWAPGLGAVNWFVLMSALNDLDHTPRLILELRDKGTIKSAAQYLEDIVPFKATPW